MIGRFALAWADPAVDGEGEEYMAYYSAVVNENGEPLDERDIYHHDTIEDALCWARELGRKHRIPVEVDV